MIERFHDWLFSDRVARIVQLCCMGMAAGLMIKFVWELGRLLSDE